MPIAAPAEHETTWTIRGNGDNSVLGYVRFTPTYGFAALLPNHAIAGRFSTWSACVEYLRQRERNQLVV